MAGQKTEARAIRQARLEEKVRGAVHRELRRGDVRQEGQKCGGSCVGVDSASSTVDGACPSPCDATKYTDDLIKRAKAAAKRAANRKCAEKSGDDDCVCKGDDNSYTEVKRQCYNGFTDDGTKFCVYEIYYKFTGTCSKGS